jgi:hypothetical protein
LLRVDYFAIFFAKAAPYAVWLSSFQRVCAALRYNWARSANCFGSGNPPLSSGAAFAIWVVKNV